MGLAAPPFLISSGDLDSIEQSFRQLFLNNGAHDMPSQWESGGQLVEPKLGEAAVSGGVGALSTLRTAAQLARARPAG